MIRKKRKQNRIVVDLTGPDGNAYVLLGLAHRLCDQLGLDWKDLHARMTSGNYENLLAQMDKTLGDYIVLER